MLCLKICVSAEWLPANVIFAWEQYYYLIRFCATRLNRRAKTVSNEKSKIQNANRIRKIKANERIMQRRLHPFRDRLQRSCAQHGKFAIVVNCKKTWCKLNWRKESTALQESCAYFPPQHNHSHVVACLSEKALKITLPDMQYSTLRYLIPHDQDQQDCRPNTGIAKEGDWNL